MGKSKKRKHASAEADAPKTKRSKHQAESTNGSLGKVAGTAAAPSLSAAAKVLGDNAPARFSDTPSGEDLKREVALYGLLGSEDQEERLLAADRIIRGLLGTKPSIENGSGASGDEVEAAVNAATLQRHLERKLMRGLASGRKGARIGFSLVLVEILRWLFGQDAAPRAGYEKLTFDTMISTLLEKTKPEGDVSGQEAKDHVFGRLFGLQCIVRAGIFGARGNEWNVVLQEILNLAQKKPWIREECGFVIIEAISQLPQAQVEHTLAQIANANLALTPEGVGIWMTAKTKYPHMKFPKKPWGPAGEPLAHLGALAQALKEGGSNTSDEAEGVKNSGVWKSKLHFVWGMLLERYKLAWREEIEHGVNFATFWKVAVDENLFSSTASNERKFLGLALFRKALAEISADAEHVSELLTPNLLKCLLNHSRSSERYLHRAALGALEAVAQSTGEHPAHTSTIVSHLLGANGAFDFDRITNTKTIVTMLKTAAREAADGHPNESSLRDLAKALRDALTKTLVKSKHDEKVTRSSYNIYCDYMFSLLDRDTFTEQLLTSHCEVLSLLCKAAYTGEDEIGATKIDSVFQSQLQERLTSYFGDVIVDLDGCQIPYTLLVEHGKWLGDVAMDDEVRSKVQEGQALMRKSAKYAKKQSKKDIEVDGKVVCLQALSLLTGLVLFQLLNAEPDAITALEDLKICYDSVLQKNFDHAQASEVFVELLLSLVSRPSALFRKVTQLVFRPFTPQLSEAALQLLGDVLGKHESMKGQQELFEDNAAEQEPEEDDASEDDELDSDVELVDDDRHGEEASDSEGEESSGTDEEEDEAELQALDTALAKVLGTDPSHDSNGVDATHDSDADMTDSEMLDLDQKLVDIFKQMKPAWPKKPAKKDAREAMINFKRRVLDLLDIYVKKEAGSNVSYTVLLPLLCLVRTTKDEILKKTAVKLIEAFTQRAKKPTKAAATSEPATNPEYVSSRLKLLKSVHDEASKSPDKLFCRVSSTVSCAIATSIVRADPAALDKIAKTYAKTQLRWLHGELDLRPNFFLDYTNWCWSYMCQGDSSRGGR